MLYYTVYFIVYLHNTYISINSFIRLLVYSFMHSFIYLLIKWFIHLFVFSWFFISLLLLLLFFLIVYLYIYLFFIFSFLLYLFMNVRWGVVLVYVCVWIDDQGWRPERFEHEGQALQFARQHLGHDRKSIKCEWKSTL